MRKQLEKKGDYILDYPQPLTRPPYWVIYSYSIITPPFTAGRINGHFP